MRERVSAPTKGASAVNFPAPEKTDSTLSDAAFLHPTSAKYVW